MQRESIFLIARQFWSNTFKSRAIYLIIAIVALMIAYAAYSGWKNYSTHNQIRTHYQQVARQSWENNPDKHPHRMAHYGSFAFRLKHALSMFDFGLESFTGNAVFLEAHKQNTINFSEASFSTGLLRFGEISLAMLLQLIIPLIIFFLGFATIASERANGTLKIILTQGANWREVLFGKSLGLMGTALLFFIPVALLTFLLLFLTEEGTRMADVLLRYAGILLTYLLFFQVISIITVLVSAFSRSSKDALIKMLAVWLLFIILLPRTTQALGSYFYASPSKIEFESAIEEEMVKVGDSHNPDDPYFSALKDSLLQVHQVSSVEELPFNYGGFVMREGERISADIYKNHLNILLETYEKQNSFTRLTAWINPYIAVKNISMALSGTDFESYINFQKQAEAYRYHLAQEMNELQMELISNEKPGPDDEPHVISSDHWKEFLDFRYQFIPIGAALQSEWGSIIALLVWSAATVGFIFYLSKKAKAI
ncbi:ABC-2 type transport system permease protein [Catalinimonas alkaloidigena]|uniref:DUF3526 domain-containing protein n=1 Tax=Catalinimonas alkaloidigena TaxID=1075417 RepID=UPI0024049200|nr:DUF3526 domain-containing protein [Catalinimonas alkaloidigena]MDF9797846.1 ABC-2 type transport system permease protein [Catalinimonas alkaloidigena]